jgi:hypothetical protein
VGYFSMYSPEVNSLPIAAGILASPASHRQMVRRPTPSSLAMRDCDHLRAVRKAFRSPGVIRHRIRTRRKSGQAAGQCFLCTCGAGPTFATDSATKRGSFEHLRRVCVIYRRTLLHAPDGPPLIPAMPVRLREVESAIMHKRISVSPELPAHPCKKGLAHF